MMRCVVLITSLLLMATAARAEVGVNLDSVLRLDGDLLKDAVESIIEHDDSHSASTALPMLLALPGQPQNGPRNLPPQLSGVGVGLQVGAPTAITIKFAGVQENGFVLGVGVGWTYGRYRSFGRYASLSVHGDYLWHLATLGRTDQVAVTFYAGVGLWLSLFGSGYGVGLVNPYYGYGSYFGVGVRVPLGLSLSLAQAPVEIYLELDPALFVFPGIDLGIGASLGFRWHF